AQVRAAAGIGPQSRAGRAPSPQARATTAPVARGADIRPAAPYGVGAPAAMAAAMVAPAFEEAQLAPATAAARPKLIALPGGATESDAPKARRFSNPTVFIAGLVLFVLTVGMIVAVQIRMTQISERVGSDLGSINVLQQQNTALKEANNRALSAARVNNAIQSSRLIEPDVDALTFLNDRAQSATLAKAVRVLEGAPAAPTAAELAAKAAAADAATGGTGVAGAAVTAAAGTTGTSTAAPPAAETSTAGTTQTASSQTATGVTP
ncbi:MAG: hypothetical protein Q7T55_14225, partial [Solirubrobacteraceae bacterium]|nr:hypothetical protein [Solirubrobacteraceae bacterium]